MMRIITWFISLILAALLVNPCLTIGTHPPSNLHSQSLVDKDLIAVDFGDPQSFDPPGLPTANDTVTIVTNGTVFNFVDAVVQALNAPGGTNVALDGHLTVR